MSAIIRFLFVPLAAATAAGIAPTSSAGSIFGQRLDMTVVAEAHAQKAGAASNAPIYYVPYDAGYIEAGDPIAGERPPSARAVEASLKSALETRGYTLADAPHQPSVLLIYHWGVLNRDSFQIRDEFHLQPNLKARLALVGTTRQAKDLKDYILTARLDRQEHFRTPVIIPPDEQDVLQDARENHYFIIVSAYDFNALAQQHQPDLLWRARLSTLSAGNAMARAIPAMIRDGVAYFGRNLSEPKYVRVSTAAAGSAPSVPTPNKVLPRQVARELSEPFVRQIASREHREFSGVE